MWTDRHRVRRRIAGSGGRNGLYLREPRPAAEQIYRVAMELLLAEGRQGDLIEKLARAVSDKLAESLTGTKGNVRALAAEVARLVSERLSPAPAGPAAPAAPPRIAIDDVGAMIDRIVSGRP
jgi:hypothetical protein